MLITGPIIYTEMGVFKNASLEISNGKIKAIHHDVILNSAKVIKFPSNYHLIPGLIDLHIHGANGHDVMDASFDSLSGISRALAAEGVTGFLATTMSATAEKIEQVLKVVSDYIQTQADHEGAKILGVHLEGPFIAAGKKGAQCSENIISPNLELVKKWLAINDSLIKIMTLAPELPQSLSLIHFLKQHHIIPSIGHTNATYQESMAAIEAGCSHVTHLFNAMSGLHQRDPGAALAALLSDQVNAEIIVDGVHVHPAMVRLALANKQKEKLILVTDAMRAKCLLDGHYELGGQTVEVAKGIPRLADGTLAGSGLKMNHALKNMVKFTGCNLADAIKMAAENPAKILQAFDKKGSISIGKDADLVILDENLEVVLTIIEGQEAKTPVSQMPFLM
jgi:N-acetylglucosamine-6-phosphate deacetylase